MSPEHPWHGVGLSDRGLLRPSNQDAFAVLNELGLWMVADGMGGHVGGDVASQLAIQSVTKHLRDLFQEALHDRPSRDSPARLTHSVQESIVAAQGEILTHASDHPRLTGMGTTLVVLAISPGWPSTGILAHVGDSRAYRLRGETLTLLTRDHSWVEEQVQSGHLAPDQAGTHPLRHVLTRALGIQDSAEPEVSAESFEKGDVVLLCTDGLTKMLDDARISSLLIANRHSPEHACRSLIDEALRLGGEDNVTVVVCTDSS